MSIVLLFIFMTFSLITYFYFEITELVEDLLYDYFSINYLSLIYIFNIIFLFVFFFSFLCVDISTSMVILYAVLFVFFDEFYIYDDLQEELDA